jgi:Fe-S oxidoreductase
MYNPRDIIEILAGNVRRTRSPFGVPHRLANRWWKSLKLPSEGEALLFTGMMYQFSPYIERTTQYLERFEDTRVADWVRFAKYQPTRLAGIGLALLASKKEKQQANQILQDITLILSKSDVNFYYRPELDQYSGILLYDLGDQENFIKHARYVTSKLEKAGIRKIITVDPHTTYALKVLYPQYTEARFEVRAYFELVNFQSKSGEAPVTLHDPCFYGRYLEISDSPREALKKQGIECLEVLNAQTYTHCCGGPAESISPKLSKEVLHRRVEELKSTGAPIVAMCPICLGNLRRSGAEAEDLSRVIARSVLSAQAVRGG